MKIIYVITGLGMGGAETQVCNLADEFSSLGHKVTIIYLTGDKVVTPTSTDINIIALDMKKTVSSTVRSLFKLTKVIKAIKPDVVHSHMVHANLLTRISRLFTKMPLLLTTAHNSNEGGKLRMLAYRFTDKLANFTTNVGQESVNAFISAKAVPSERIVSMPNGINIDIFHPDESIKQNIRSDFQLDNQQKMVLAVGRNDIQKDYPNMLKSISLLSKELNYKLFIVGLDVEFLQPQVDSFELSQNIELLGLRTDVDQLMAAADILLMSSEWEGLPIVIGEAMASECNIVTTNAGGCKEWLTTNEKPVEVKNAKSLADSLTAKLKLSDDELSLIGQANRNHIIKQFSLAGIVAKWQIMYNGNFNG